MTGITFSFFARSGVKINDYIKITIPDPFEFETGKFPPNTVTRAADPEQFYSSDESVLNIIGPVRGMRGLFGISAVNGNNIAL